MAHAPLAVRGGAVGRLMPWLALAGGTPVRTRPFPAWPQAGGLERAELIEVLESGNWGGYPFPNRRAETFAERFGRRLLGYNYRLTELQAAVLLGQLERLPEQTRWREERARRLGEGLAPVDGIRLLRRDERQTTQAIYQFVFKYDAAAFGGASRDRFVAALEAEGIPCDGLFYEPVYRSALFRVDPAEFPALGGRLPWAGASCPVAERAACEESVWIPHRVLLGTDEDVDQVVEAVAKIRDHLDELGKAEHPLLAQKCLNRAERDRGARARPRSG